MRGRRHRFEPSPFRTHEQKIARGDDAAAPPPPDGIAGISSLESIQPIRSISRQIGTIGDLPRSTNPDAMSAPKVTDMVAAYDLDARSFHCILVHRLDYRPPPAPAVGNVVVFSEPAYAPFRAEKLQLATPAYYRHGMVQGPAEGVVCSP